MLIVGREIESIGLGAAQFVWVPRILSGRWPGSLIGGRVGCVAGSAASLRGDAGSAAVCPVAGREPGSGRRPCPQV